MDYRDHTELILVEEEKSFAKMISDLIDKKEYKELRRMAEQMLSQDIANVIEELDAPKALAAFRLLPKELAAEAFVEMEQGTKRRLIEAFTDKELSGILDELYIDDTVDIIEEMPANVVKRILRTRPTDNRDEINKLLNYPKNSAGTVMTTEYVRFRADMTVAEALDHVRSVAIDSETIYTCYVTDKHRKLLGIVTAKQLLISDHKDTMADIMDEYFVSVYTTDDREEVARTLEKYGFLALPVVDTEKRLVGIITVDDAMDVIKEESEEDFAKMAAITPTETPYLKTGIFTIWKARIPWLLVLLISATFSSTILTGFESVLPTVLLLFVPMLMDTGGNSGSQTSVTVIRGISLSEIKFRDIGRVICRELGVGVLCGVTLGTVAFGKVMLVDRLIMQNPEVTVTVAFSVSLALALTVVIAKLIGAALPILAKRIGLDPAVMASPFITTVVDALSLVLYFLIAKALII